MSAYIAGWSTAETPLSIVVDGAPQTLTDAYGTHFAHVALGDGGVTGEPDYVALAPALALMLADTIDVYAVTFSTATNRYTISHATTPFPIAFTGESGTNMRRALGFAGDRTSALSHTSDVTPYYLIEQAVSARSEYQGPREPDDLGNESVDDGGSAFGVFRESSEILDHWTQQCETKAATFTHAATATVPWTWQAFFRHCRMTHPFTVYDGVSDANDGPHVYRLRAEGAAMTADIVEPMEDDVDTYWLIAIRARDLGVLP